MSAEELPKEFEKGTEVLPFSKYGLSSFEDFKLTEKEIHHLEWLKKIGLSSEEIQLYQDSESGLLDKRKKVESTVLRKQLDSIYKRIHGCENGAEPGSSKQQQEEPSTSEAKIFERLQKTTTTFYPPGHPMNEIKELEESLFGHLKTDMLSINKRRKIMRRLERKKERLIAEGKELIPPIDHSSNVKKKGSLWDVKERLDDKQKAALRRPVLGPKKRTMYTIKGNKIVRLEPIANQQNERQQNDLGSVNDNQPQNGNNENKIVRLQPSAHDQQNERQDLGSDNDIQPQNEHNEILGNENNADDEFRAVDIVLPVNSAEEQLLEGTKMCIDDIRKIERFKDYEPGMPSKVLYLKNISPSVTQEQLAILFIQFQLENGGPIDVRLMTGRMRGQAFVSFNSEDLAIRALDEVNGTILSGKPIIAQFGRNSNRIQDNDR